MHIPLIYPIDSFLGLCMFKFFLAWFMNLFAYMQAWAYLCTVHVHLQWCILAIPPLSQEPGASQAQFPTRRGAHMPGLLRLARGCSPMCFWSLCAWVAGCTHSVSHTRLEIQSGSSGFLLSQFTTEKALKAWAPLLQLLNNSLLISKLYRL